jgi:hypothetical protein
MNSNARRQVALLLVARSDVPCCFARIPSVTAMWARLSRAWVGSLPLAPPRSQTFRSTVVLLFFLRRLAASNGVGNTVLSGCLFPRGGRPPASWATASSGIEPGGGYDEQASSISFFLRFNAGRGAVRLGCGCPRRHGLRCIWVGARRLLQVPSPQLQRLAAVGHVATASGRFEPGRLPTPSSHGQRWPSR